MKKLFALSIFSFSLLFGLTPSKADWTHYLYNSGHSGNPGKLYKYNSETGESKFIANFEAVMNADNYLDSSAYAFGINENNGNPWIEVDVENTDIVFECDEDKGE